MTTCRAPRDADVAALAAIRNDAPTQEALLADPRPNSEADVRRWIERRTTDPAALFWVIADADDGGAVGFAQVVAIDARSRHGRFGIAIGRAHRGRGHGGAALRHVLRAARDDGRLDKLMLDVAADNTSARALYHDAGFRDVGVLRRHYRGNDRWHDVVVMERFLEAVA